MVSHWIVNIQLATGVAIAKIGLAVNRTWKTETGEQKEDTGLLRVTLPTQTGNPSIPLGARVPTDKLSAGAYTVEIKAVDNAGKEFKRTADFQIE